MPAQIEKWDTFELALRGPDSGNPFLEVTLEAEFTHGTHRVRGPGFYDGGGIYKVRLMPDQEGEWEFVTRSNTPALDGQRGTLICTAASALNHGPVRVADTIHFAYADGTPYSPVGTTCYVWNLQGDELEAQTLMTLSQAPFNKLRMCVFPKRYTFNNNEPPLYPFPGQVTGTWSWAQRNTYRAHEPPDFWDFTHFNPPYFRHLEQRILDLRALGIEADLILFHPYDFGAWGFDRMPAEVNDRYLRYVVARLSAYRNLWWSFANEYDLMRDRTLADWDHYFQLVQELDPYQHLRSIHNCHEFYDHGKPWVTHCSVQSHALTTVPAWIKKYGKPVVVDECGYEGDIFMAWGDLSAEELVLRFWLGFTSGGYVGHGETYMNDLDQLWWSKGGRLTGQSVARIAFLRQIMEHAPALTPIMRNDSSAAAASSAGTPHEPGEETCIISEGSWNAEAAGFQDQDYYLLYFGMHQPRWRNLNLPAGSYRVDVIDTWNMTLQTATADATGRMRVELPGRKYMAVRIKKNQ